MWRIASTSIPSLNLSLKSLLPRVTIFFKRKSTKHFFDVFYSVFTFLYVYIAQSMLDHLSIGQLQKVAHKLKEFQSTSTFDKFFTTKFL